MRVRSLGILVAFLLTAAGLWLAAPFGGEERPLDFFAWGRFGRTKPATFDRPRCVAFAPDGTLYVLDLTGRIQHFTAAGEYLNELRMPDVSVGRPQGLDVGPDGCVYVADTHYFRVVKFNPAGKIVLTFGRKGRNPGEFFWPCAIVVDAAGNIYTAEYGGNDRIQKFDPTGKLLACWGTFGEEPGQFMRPAGLALGPGGNLYVADAANHRVQVFTREGKFLRSWGRLSNEPGGFNYPYDICIDAAGRVYTIEYGAHRVQCFSRQGELLVGWGRLDREKNGLNHPWGLDVTPAGTIYVADTMNCRVVRAPLPAVLSDANSSPLAGGKGRP